MPADVETMFYAGEVPWHGLGKSVLTEVNAERAIKLAELDWDVETAPIITNDDKRTAIENYRITRRIQDNAILGIVKKGFVPIQNRDAFRMFDEVVGKGKAAYHTAGALQGGSKVFIVSKLPGMLEVGKGIGPVDEVERYLLLSNSHDGTRPLQMLFTPVRVVCSNTLSLALSPDGDDDVTRLSPRVTVRHTKHSKFMVKEAERTMKKALQYYERFGNFAGFLYSKQVDEMLMKDIVAGVFPANRKGLVTPAIQEHRFSVERLFDEGEGHDKIAGSAWALLNAFTQYADHSYSLRKAKEPQDRAYSILMGGARGMKNRATKVIAKVFA